MQNLNFKTWILNEIADFGFGGQSTSKVQGGTTTMSGEKLFKNIETTRILKELMNLTMSGPFAARKIWEDTIQYGDGFGAIKVNVTPLGSERFIVRQKIHDLKGEECYLCHGVYPLHDDHDQNKETEIANMLYDKIKEISRAEVPGPVMSFNKFEDLAKSLWAELKVHHPSYCMFPVGFKKMNENWYKAVFEFRGHGVMSQNNNPTGRSEQFHLDILWDQDKGLIRSWGYPIDSSLRQHTWAIQPSEWDEWFSPRQDKKSIIENIVKSFMQF